MYFRKLFLFFISFLISRKNIFFNSCLTPSVKFCISFMFSRRICYLDLSQATFFFHYSYVWNAWDSNLLSKHMFKNKIYLESLSVPKALPHFLSVNMNQQWLKHNRWSSLHLLQLTLACGLMFKNLLSLHILTSRITSGCSCVCGHWHHFKAGLGRVNLWSLKKMGLWRFWDICLRWTDLSV